MYSVQSVVLMLFLDLAESRVESQLLNALILGLLSGGS